MGITNANKEITVTRIDCNGTFNVRLSLTAEPNIVENPTDIVLVLDRSGSMSDSIDELQDGANAFIDIIDEATDGSQDGQIGNGSRIGIVSFATAATQDTQLITSVADLKAAVNALDADGNTNHADAFTQGLALFDSTSDNAKVMVMFTDGVTTVGGDPNAVATLAKSQGVTIYIIGLAGNGGLDETALRQWSSQPSSSYVAIAPSDADLEELFEDLAQNITNPGATNIVVNDVIDDCFRISALSSPSKGTASMLSPTSIQWRIDELGVTQSEGATLEFTVEHVGDCAGAVEVNESITYDDAEGNVVSFPSPTIQVDCGIIVIPEVCPEPVELTVDGCVDTLEFAAGELGLEAQGRIVQLDVTLTNVCPGRRVALAVILNELDAEDQEYKRGMKVLTIPAHDRDSCQDITIRCISFVLPEELSVAEDSTSICAERRFRARFLCHYIDNDFSCCDEDEE